MRGRWRVKAVGGQWRSGSRAPWAGPGDAAAADPVPSIVGTLLGLAGAVAAIGGWAWRHRRAADLPPTAEQVDQATATLAGAVLEQWTREAQVRALGDPEPMPVRWRLASPTLMDHQQVINPGGGTLTFTGSSDRIHALTAAFEALPRRRLVITGGAGTGKTTLAVQLLLDLLPAQGEPPTSPVPVLFSLTGWASDTAASTARV